MKTTRLFTIVISGSLLAYFLAALIMFAVNHFRGYAFSEHLTYNLLLAQTVAFALATSIVLAATLSPARKRAGGSANAVTKIVRLTEMNATAEEYFLSGRTSVLIGKAGATADGGEGGDVSNEFAVINRVNDFWYIERVSDERSVGLKRAGEQREQYVYKLKTGLCYKLQVNDVIYIENERLLVE